MSYLIVIPARFESSRLPGKPLVELCGVPMIVRTYRQCRIVAPGDSIVVATDDNRIRDVCNAEGIKVIMTSKDCLTGTDRVAEVGEKIAVDTYINVQGDEPVFNPDDLRRLIEKASQHPEDIINGFCAIAEVEQFFSRSTPKVVSRPDGRLLYMSRSPIPGNKAGTFTKGWRQVCAYAFPRKALNAFAACKSKTQLEEQEDIEILRFLELGFEVRMMSMSNVSVAVDNPEDIKRAETAIRQMGLE